MRNRGKEEQPYGERERERERELLCAHFDRQDLVVFLVAGGEEPVRLLLILRLGLILEHAGPVAQEYDVVGIRLREG